MTKEGPQHRNPSPFLSLNSGHFPCTCASCDESFVVPLLSPPRSASFLLFCHGAKIFLSHGDRHSSALSPPLPAPLSFWLIGATDKTIATVVSVIGLARYYAANRLSPVVAETRGGNHRATVPGSDVEDDNDNGVNFAPPLPARLFCRDRPHVRGLRLPKHHHMGIANGGSDGAVPYLPSVSSRRGARDDDSIV